MGNEQKAQLVIDAKNMAVTQRKPNSVIHHCDNRLNPPCGDPFSQRIIGNLSSTGRALGGHWAGGCNGHKNRRGYAQDARYHPDGIFGLICGHELEDLYDPAGGRSRTMRGRDHTSFCANQASSIGPGAMAPSRNDPLRGCLASGATASPLGATGADLETRQTVITCADVSTGLFGPCVDRGSARFERARQVFNTATSATSCPVNSAERGPAFSA